MKHWTTVGGGVHEPRCTKKTYLCVSSLKLRLNYGWTLLVTNNCRSGRSGNSRPSHRASTPTPSSIRTFVPGIGFCNLARKLRIKRFWGSIPLPLKKHFKKTSTLFRQNVKNVQHALNNFLLKPLFWNVNGHPVFVVRTTKEIMGVQRRKKYIFIGLRGGG